MHTITFDESEVESESRNVEIWVAGQRRITISVNDRNTSIQILMAIGPESVNFGKGSFFLRTPDHG